MLKKSCSFDGCLSLQRNDKINVDVGATAYLHCTKHYKHTQKPAAWNFFTRTAHTLHFVATCTCVYTQWTMEWQSAIETLGFLQH